MTAPAPRMLRIELHSFWHPGTGRGDGAAADAVVHRGADGLPELPGRTVKGLLRAACELSAQAGLDWSLRPSVVDGPDSRSGVEWLFGSTLARANGDKGVITGDNRVRELERGRYGSQAGRLRIESARLGQNDAQRAAWGRVAIEHPSALQHLRRTLATTQLDESGVAADHTLRSVEVLVPMTLFARLSFEPWPAKDPATPEQAAQPAAASAQEWERLCGLLDQAARLFLRSVGSGRNRGLGRCTAALEVLHG